jgi:hypothetical protein
MKVMSVEKRKAYRLYKVYCGWRIVAVSVKLKSFVLYHWTFEDGRGDDQDSSSLAGASML